MPVRIQTDRVNKNMPARRQIMILCIAVITFLLSSFTLSTAATYQGADRYETAALVAIGTGQTDITIASGENFPDALSASNLRNPILLVKKDTIPPVTLDAIYAIEPTSITIVGGTDVISEEVEGQLSNYAPLTRLAGADRYETNALTIQGDSIPLTIVSGEKWADALSAANLGNQIVLTTPTTLSTTAAQIIAHHHAYNVILVGGTEAVNGLVEQQIARMVPLQRLGGANRYETNLLTIGDFSVLNIVTGEKYPDGLVASLLDDQLLLLGEPAYQASTNVSYQWLTDYRSNVVGINYVGGGLNQVAIEAALNGTWEAPSTPPVVIPDWLDSDWERVAWSSAYTSNYTPNESSTMTASGYKMSWTTMCVAHRSLPFGTVVQFHKDGNYCFAVVTDRGPYIY
jgi:putative cell wall-binding protein